MVDLYADKLGPATPVPESISHGSPGNAGAGEKRRRTKSSPRERRLMEDDGLVVEDSETPRHQLDKLA